MSTPLIIHFNKLMQKSLNLLDWILNQKISYQERCRSNIVDSYFEVFLADTTDWWCGSRSCLTVSMNTTVSMATNPLPSVKWLTLSSTWAPNQLRVFAMIRLPAVSSWSLSSQCQPQYRAISLQSWAWINSAGNSS